MWSIGLLLCKHAKYGIDFSTVVPKLHVHDTIVLDKAEYSASESTLNSSIVSYCLRMDGQWDARENNSFHRWEMENK